MAVNNVNTSSRVVKDDSNVEPFELGTFINNNPGSNEPAQITMTQNPNDVLVDSEVVINEIKSLHNSLNIIAQKVNTIENEGVRSRDLDQQIIEALKDLKNYSTFFEQATFQLESKILKTSLSIAQKVIGIEVGENSAAIAKSTITTLMDKVKTASKVTIHLNPKDYVVLKDNLNFGETVALQEDPNVTAGGVVIASDLGNFDGNVEAKVQTMIESLEAVI